MDRRDDNTSVGSLFNPSDYGIHDFINEPNFEQFIELIRGESADSIAKFCPNYDCEQMNGCLDGNQFGPDVGDLFEFNPACAAASNPDSVVDSLPSIDGETKGGEEDIDGEEDSSGDTTTTPTKKTKVDRSRTLISERRRRVRMKEKLYALRSLVPNITKVYGSFSTEYHAS